MLAFGHPARRFRPTPRKCNECHGGDDAHRGTLGNKCESCHSPTGRSLFTGTLRSGQNQLIPSRGPIVVRLGYTPAITIAVDGVDLDLSGLAQTTSINFQST